MSTVMDANRLAGSGHRAWSIVDQLTAFLARRRARRAYRRDCVEIESLSDRTLRDIGVTRGEIRGLVDELSRNGGVRTGRVWKV